MMKSCVIFTLQGANNIGAFLQAYGLMTVLKRLEIDLYNSSDKMFKR